VIAFTENNVATSASIVTLHVYGDEAVVGTPTAILGKIVTERV